MKRIEELTGLRCLAVGMVLLAHATHVMPVWMAHFIRGDVGDTGVQIFFVLSGFLITRLLMREYERTGKVDFWGFYRRRLLRISPAFYFFLAVMGVFATMGVIKANWPQFVAAGTYTWNYAHFLHIDSSFKGFPEGNWYLGHTWSLCLEEQFYWAWPGTFLLIVRYDLRRLLTAIILVVPIVRMASYVFEPYVRDQLHMMFHTGIDTILVGCFLAMHRPALEKRLRPILGSQASLPILIGIVFLVLPLVEAELGGYWLATYGATIEAALIALLMLCILTQPRHPFCQLLRSPPFVFIGVISYSLYLWQQFFTMADSPVYTFYPFNIVSIKLPVCTLGSVAAACLSYYIVEKPFLILKDRKRKDP
jgi:peptidoglycan/LPS O-acetylase OafA/YrhL